MILNEGTIGGQLVLTHAIANYPGVFALGDCMMKRYRQVTTKYIFLSELAPGGKSNSGSIFVFKNST
jgi:hypothetical protein